MINSIPLLIFKHPPQNQHLSQISLQFYSNSPHYQTAYPKQECIPVGCVPSAAVAVCGERGVMGCVCPGGVCLVGVSAGGCLPWGVCPGGVCPGVSAQESVCLGVSVLGGVCLVGICRGVCLGGCLSRECLPVGCLPGGCLPCPLPCEQNDRCL